MRCKKEVGFAVCRVITSDKFREHRWGHSDCAIFIADCIKEISGVDIASDVRGSYSSKKEAIAKLRATGGVDARLDSSLSAVVDQLADGDIVKINRVGYGVFMAGKVWTVDEKEGIGVAMNKKIIKSWRVK